MGARIVEPPPDSKVAADCVLFKSAEANRRRTTSINISGISAESRNLELIVADKHRDHSELRTDRNRMIKQLQHDLGTRIGRDIEILGLDSEYPIAHTSPGEHGAKARID